MSLSVILFLLSTCFGIVEPSSLLRRDNGDSGQTAFSPAAVEVIVIALALFASCLLSLYLCRRYKPTQRMLPLYTLPAPRYRLQGGIRISTGGNHRGRRPVQGASPVPSRPFFSRVPISPDEGTGMVSIRSMPIAHVKTKVVFPTAGTPPIRQDSTVVLDTV